MKNLVKFLFLFMLTLAVTSPVHAADLAKIDQRTDVAMETFYKEVKGGKDLINKSAGYLIFPKITKAGIGLGYEQGDGKLVVGGQTQKYYRTRAASVGLQLGGQVRSQILVFMQKDALERFVNSDGWEIGVDGSVVLVDMAAAGAIDSTNYNQPILGFVFSNKGLMYNLSLEGSKISKLDD